MGLYRCSICGTLSVDDGDDSIAAMANRLGRRCMLVREAAPGDRMVCAGTLKRIALVTADGQPVTVERR